MSSITILQNLCVDNECMPAVCMCCMQVREIAQHPLDEIFADLPGSMDSITAAQDVGFHLQVLCSCLTALFS